MCKGLYRTYYHLCIYSISVRFESRHTYQLPLISVTLPNPLVLCNLLLPRPFQLQDLPPQNALSSTSITYPDSGLNVEIHHHHYLFLLQQSVLSSFQCSSKSFSSPVPNDGYTIFFYKSPFSKNQHPPPFLCIFTSSQAHPLLSSKTQTRLSTIDMDTEPAAAASIGCMSLRNRTRAVRSVYYIGETRRGKFMGGGGK
jgi:hypothetical protein